MDLHSLIEQTVAGLGYELVDLEQSPRGRVLRVFIDLVPKPEAVEEAVEAVEAPAAGAKPAAVGIEDCVVVSNQLSRVLTVENIDYDRLEVSSPGLDRPLTKAADYDRFAGAEVNLRSRLPVAGRRNFSGVLLGLQDGKVRLQVGREEMTVELDNVDKARLVPKFG